MHGITILEPVTGTRFIRTVALAVIGLVATAEDADAEAFPLNTPVLVTDVRRAIGDAGTDGTLARSLGAIADQASPIVIVVRVAEGEDQPGTETNVIGGVAGGAYTGMQALLAAEAQLGVRPRILGCPGLDSQAVTTALVVIAKKLRGFVYAACRAEDGIAIAPDDAAALLYRGEFGDRELMLIYPDFTGFEGHAVAAAMGTRARIDEEVGWHKTLSNFAVNNVTGISKDVFFDIRDPSTAAALLNDGDVTTLVRMNGYRFWGNRTCSDEPLFAFESAVRTSHALQDSIADGLAWAVDKPITQGLVRDIEETINAFFRSHVAAGRLIGGRAWFDPALNSAANLAAGQVVIDYDFTPCAPAESITLNQRITDRYYGSIAA
ncbi:phage tail sheath subtilisin-like domain-containing protein [Sphingosinicella sp. CPCC 101087]|uniref:phage tail sheath subtilisin-like domain-containing protein n=1 Tax=Sphingosinicella sp. CPCC 101087 TaxID=2497754 RepID=UPI00101D6877|nr:phage tail sheath subtilisin-like domain-containing protein [Sphingosinicella sp. CPCC 101087]